VWDVLRVEECSPKVLVVYTDDMNVKPQHTSAITEQTVGEAIRELRENQRISVRTLASKAGFSPSFISQVENGQASPSINSLERIAECLGLTLGAFFNALEPREAAVTRAHERRQLTSGWSKAKIDSLGSGGAALAMEPVLVTLAIGGSNGKAATPPSHEEFVFVLDGEVTLTLAANDFVLRMGDAAAIPAGQLRKFRNSGDCPARIIIVSARSAVGPVR
jgi:transcriptional regulator with XRE-family HTH domain